MTTRDKSSSSSDSSVADLAARVHALIAQWREEARRPDWIGNTSAILGCADALEAALAAALAPQPEKAE